MSPPGENDLTFTLYGLPIHNGEVNADVFANKLKTLISALRKLDSSYNTKKQHEFLIHDMAFASASIMIRENRVKSKPVRQSPTKRFVQIGAMASENGSFRISTAAEEYALKAYNALSKGAGDSFSYGVVDAPAVHAVRIDRVLHSRVQDIISQAKSAAIDAPPRYFSGTSYETYDGILQVVDLRGLFPEGKLVLSAGGREISCVVPQAELETLRQGLGRRVLLSGKARHDGRSMLPTRIDVVSIKPISDGSNIVQFQGAMEDLEDDPLRDVAL